MVGSDQVYRPSGLAASLWSEHQCNSSEIECTDFALRFSLSLTRPRERRPASAKKQNLPAKERSFAELRFASFPLPLWGWGGLSRVEMNALRAPLTALPAQRKKCVYFLLDMADDFIAGFASPNRRAAAFREKAPQVDFGGPPSSVGLAVPHLERMALGAGDCSTRDRPGLAPQGLSSLLGMEDSAGPAGKTHACPRSPQPDPQDVPRESHLGCAAHPRRVAQTRHQPRDHATFGTMITSPSIFPEILFSQKHVMKALAVV